MKWFLGAPAMQLKQALGPSSGAFLSVAISATLGVVWMFSSVALAAELNGFRLESQSDGSLSVNVQADSLPAYDIEPSGNGVSITLKDTHLSDSLRQKGMPVVIDNRNRAIGRAVPGDDNTVKIVIPNWKPEQGTLRVKNDTGATAAETPRGASRSSSAPSERLSGAFQSQFKSAAQALSRPATAPLEDTTVSLPAVETTTQPRTSTRANANASGSKSATRRKKVIYRSVIASSVALPKVVNYSQPTQDVAQLSAPRPVVTPSENASASPLTLPLSTPRSAASVWPVVAQPIPTAESTGWGSYGQSSNAADNLYGLNSIADAAEATMPASPSMGAQLKQFFDGITGNRFSRPYGVAFWAMMVGVIFVACLGFLALAIGLLCTRLVFTPFGAVGGSAQEAAKPSRKERNKQGGLFSWRNTAPDDEDLDEEISEGVQPAPLRGPVAKRFPFLASGLSHSVSAYTPQPQTRSSATETYSSARTNAPKSFSERPAPFTASSRQRFQPENSANGKASQWRPHLSVSKAPMAPALLRNSQQTVASSASVGAPRWSHPEDDADLIPTPTRNSQPQSSVERALHRLTL